MKIVIDSNVFFRAILGRKAGSASKTVIPLITEGRVSPYTCNALIGEIGRVVKKDKKLSQIDPIYFRQYIDGIDGWLTYVPMKDLEHDQKMLNNIGNDWYLIAISKCVRANCIITYDKHLLSLKNELKEKEGVDLLT